jgi:hypothetical protein
MQSLWKWLTQSPKQSVYFLLSPLHQESSLPKQSQLPMPPRREKPSKACRTNAILSAPVLMASQLPLLQENCFQTSPYTTPERYLTTSGQPPQTTTGIFQILPYGQVDAPPQSKT